MYREVTQDLAAFNRMLNSVVPTGADTKYEGIWAADPAVSRMLRAIGSWMKLFSGAFEIMPIEPEVIHLGKVAVVFQDTPSGSPARLGQDARDRGEWRSPRTRKPFIQFFRLAYRLLRQHGLDHLWYGKIFVLPRIAAGKNPHGSQWGVGANYSRLDDTIRVFSDPTDYTPTLLIHELAHRYWYKFLNDQERRNFGKWFGEVPATTEYGKVDTAEDFAEVFAWYVTGRHLNKAQISRLKTFFGRKHRLEDVNGLFYRLKALRLS